MEKLLSGDLRYSKFAGGEDQASPACERCVYWVYYDSGYTHTDYGVCHRHAPPAVTVLKGEEFQAQWPTTAASEWCGEHRQRPPRQPE